MIAFLNWLDGVLWGLPLIVLMIATGLYFTVRSGFFQFRHFGWIMKRTAGQMFVKDENKGKAQNEKGMLSSFEAISTAIGGTVGFGNIAGVATAVAAGGPGAVVWMWLTSLIGMILKQVEVTLGCYYRREHENGDFYGGPTYYMERGLGKERHWGKLWLIPALNLFDCRNSGRGRYFSGSMSLCPDLYHHQWRHQKDCGSIQQAGSGDERDLYPHGNCHDPGKYPESSGNHRGDFYECIHRHCGDRWLRRLCSQRDGPCRYGSFRILQ